MAPEGAGGCRGPSAASRWALQPSAKSAAGINCLAFGLWFIQIISANEISPQDTGTAMLSPEQASRVWCVRGKVLAAARSRKKKNLVFSGNKATAAVIAHLAAAI